MARLLRGFIATAVIWLLASPMAMAQQYEDETGDLDLEVHITLTVTLAGEGYVADSVVYVSLTPGPGLEAIDLGTLPTDAQGRFFGEITIPDGLDPDTYVLTATGVTSQGATRVLSAQLGIGQEVTLTPATTTTSSSRPTIVTPAPLDRGNGLDPITNAATDKNSDPVDRILLVRVLMVGLVGLGGLWWWLYGVAHR